MRYEVTKALERSDNLVNDGSTECHTDLRAIREALVALVFQLEELSQEVRAGRG